MAGFVTPHYDAFKILIAEFIGARPKLYHGTHAAHRNRVRMFVMSNNMSIEHISDGGYPENWTNDFPTEQPLPEIFDLEIK